MKSRGFNRAFNPAFTLVELLVVIGIIVVLVAMLLPSINRAWSAAQFVNCQSNLRQFGMATQLYVNDNRQVLPFPNWNWENTSQYGPCFCNGATGWLYTCPLPSPSTVQASYVQTGNLWPYLLTLKVYHCPAQIIGDTGVDPNETAEVLSSYLMNGAMCGYGAANLSLPVVAHLPAAYYFKITQFQPDDALMWEGAEADSTANNDGSTYPSESYNANGNPQGATTRHGRYISLLSMDGHVEAMSTADYWAMANATTRNRLWCNPLVSSGQQIPNSYVGPY